MNNLQKIIVIAPGKGMGNFISMTSCFQCISDQYKEKITILTKANTSAKMYFENQKFCDDIIYFEESKRGILNIFHNIKIFFKFISLLKSLDAKKLFILHPSKKYTYIGYFCKIKNMYAPGYKLQNFFLTKKNKLYQSYFSKPLDPLIESQNLIKKIFNLNKLETGLLVNKKSELKKYIGICIATSGFEKQWGINNYIRIIKYLISKGHKKFVILSGKDQVEIEKDLVKGVITKDADIEIIKTSEKKMDFIYESLKEIYCYIGNDTGISHLSIALGIKSIIIHGDCPPHDYSNLIYAVDNIEKIRSKTSIKKILFEQVKDKIDLVLK